MGNSDPNNPNGEEFNENQLVLTLLEQNRLREEQMDKIINKLMDQRTVTQQSSPMLLIISQTVFNGKTGDTDVAKEWLNALKAVALMNKWSDTCILETGRSHLDGAARNWYLSHMNELDSFAKFTTAFEETFTSQESVTDTGKRMNGRVQKRDETVFAYFHERRSAPEQPNPQK
ncbi:unnamed protein product [Macrosiphum euphorbiae]|nr:unnamed protein product [Macrosiphum euphorbiae]